MTSEPCHDDSHVGCYANGRIHINENLDSESTEQTVMHELGHAFGALHLPVGNGIMSRDMSTATRCITQSDLDLVCSSNECLWEKPEC